MAEVLAALQCKYESSATQPESLSFIVYKDSVEAEDFMRNSWQDAQRCEGDRCGGEEEPGQHNYFADAMDLGSDAFVWGDTSYVADLGLGYPYLQTVTLVVRAGLRVCASAWVGPSQGPDLRPEVLETLRGVVIQACGLTS